MFRGPYGHRNESDVVFPHTETQEARSALYPLASHRPEVLFQIHADGW